MSTKTTFLLPDFDKNIPNKVNEKVEVKSQHVLSIKETSNWHFAIATAGFSSKIDGVSVFAMKIDNIGNGHLFVGFTDLKTYDSKKTGCPGDELTGTSLYCYFGNRWPAGAKYLPKDITLQAKEIISILTISNNGGKKEIMFIADGNDGAVVDCTKDFGNGDEFFPCISLRNSGQQVEFIPFDQVKSRSPKIDELLKKYSPSSSNHNNNQQQQSSPALGQLQQELEKEKQHAKTLEAQLQQKDQQLQDEKNNVTSLTTQLQQEKQNSASKDAEIDRLRQLLNPSPFVKDKLYQIDFSANGITPPADPNAFGTLLKLPSAASSPLFSEVRSMFRTAGSQIPVPSPVAGFELKEIEVIVPDVSTIESRIRRLQQLRAKDVGTFFNPSSNSFNVDQLQTLISLRDQFLPRSSNADPKSPNLINVFHGTKIAKLDSVVHGLVAVRSTDAGYFGSGVYTTTSIEYAAKYARGDFDDKNGPYPPRTSDGCIPVVWCVAAVGVCYPLTREDYQKRNDGNSDFFGVGLKPGYDCHCVGVSQTNGFQAVPRKDMQYMEIVFDQEAQVLPIAVLWMKPM